VGILLTMGFHRAFFTNSSFFHHRILAIRKPLTRIFSFSMESRLSRSPFHEFFFHNGISAITKPFSRTFFFFTMGFWLSRSLSHDCILFQWNLGYHDALYTNLEYFSFSRWKSGYQGAFHTNFFSFTMELWLSRSLSHELFLFHDGILAIKESFTRTFLFHDGIHKIRDLEEDSYHICHKEYLHRIHLVKNLAS
jgi:hypothetical protein